MIRKDTDLVPKNQFFVRLQQPALCFCVLAARIEWMAGSGCESVCVYLSLTWSSVHAVVQWLYSIAACITNKSHKWAYSRAPILLFVRSSCELLYLPVLLLLSLLSHFSAIRGATLFHSISFGHYAIQYSCRMSLLLCMPFWRRHEMANLRYASEQ